ncbi:MAG: Crossover junction endodeoxyribonuclease RuvC [Chlamydiae bacterium]|nr:Crossover junction endodeoxyribonuclease RuvC [Chlamydiota bacterium]
MIIIGIDPGTIVCGYGIIRMDGSSYTVIDYGCIRPPKGYKLSERYLVIFDGIDELLEKHHPDAVVVETQYVKKNVQSAIKLGMARGMVILAAAKRVIPIYEYAPTKAKLAVVGSGRASKQQVQGMVQRLLNLSCPPEPEDAADALSLAICHAQSTSKYNFIATEV